MICPQCQTENAFAASTCIKCGQRFGPPVEVVSSASNVSSTSAPKARSMNFLRNLNVFIACLVIGGMTAAGPLAMVIYVVGKPLFGDKAISTYGYPLGYLLMAAVLAFIWWRTGLSAEQAMRGREGRFRTGHVVLAIINILAVVSFAGPMLLARMSGNSNLAMLAWLAVPVYGLGFLAWPIGLFMVWSSGSTSRDLKPA